MAVVWGRSVEVDLYELNEYRSTADWPYSICAGSVVYRLGDEGAEVLLLIRRAGAFPQLADNYADTYNLPKGHVEFHESLESAALRETAEEAGVKAELKTYLGALHMKFVDGEINRDKIIHYFAGKWVSDIADMDNEHSDKVWYPIDKAISLLGKIGDDNNPKQEQVIAERLKDYLGIISG